MVIDLVLQLVPGDGDLLGIHHDDKIAGIHTRCKNRLVLP
jgi:hypothetical protein